MNEILSKSELTAWLESNNQSGRLPVVLRALDSLYQSGPTSEEITKSQTKLHRSFLIWAQQVIFYDGFSHPLVGRIFLAVNRRGLVALNFGVTEGQFLAQLDKYNSKAIIRSSDHTSEVTQEVYEYLNGDRTHFDLSVDLSQMSEFQKGVLLTTLEIPHGQIVTYGEIARRLGNPKSARAVGQALGHNPIPIVIPCHRVIASNGSLGGYSAGGGLETKAKLLSLEGASLV